MANSYSQIYLQLIFTVKYRRATLDKTWRDELFSFMSGIINNTGNKTVIINGVEDHLHCFLILKPNTKISELTQKVKSSSSKWINENNLTPQKFQWQSGYGVFSYSKSHVGRVYNYIKNQEIHHKEISFKQEYLDFLKKFGIPYEERYIFEELK